ncbi:MAG: AbrB/MazE/SpoVT family DNA-binding domain-containing protein [Alicyclobacillus macrosporangiidus]|uniref:AbrB/MazE/SpoVT family DNA-binding domain-containing protein n=1 Tax=Alicyclobacillus macrosporangiidus TaxID=392015 RepID=UPI0026ECCCE4|nr:AbrB/MazE/SpoVT family DNA-binding domain-containing protein [Alicyclobacillus macrosporangiidus]MCL6600068.1 AbrB/MazE/SpoVT family DNA-binding domain-containing protein [Alicyclobacillus macrosporangiidus]
MMSIAKLSPKFQITVPSEVRDALGVQPGDKILFHQKPNGEIVIRRVPRKTARELAGSLGRASGKNIPYVPLEEARRITYNELSERLTSEFIEQKGHMSDDGGDVK